MRGKGPSQAKATFFFFPKKAECGIERLKTTSSEIRESSRGEDFILLACSFVGRSTFYLILGTKVRNQWRGRELKR